MVEQYDNTNSGTCASDLKTECFFPVLALNGVETPDLWTHSTHFSLNYANITGSTLYNGGLLDRCAVNQFAKFATSIAVARIILL